MEGKNKPGVSLIENAIKEGWIRVIPIKNTDTARLLLTILDYGEAEAIVLAQETQADLIILDNREPRLFASQAGLKVIGTIGVILKGYERGLVKDPMTEIYKLKKQGFYIGDRLLTYVKSIINE